MFVLTTAQADDLIRHATRAHVDLFEKNETVSQWFSDSSGFTAYEMGDIQSTEFVEQYVEFLLSDEPMDLSLTNQGLLG